MRWHPTLEWIFAVLVKWCYASAIHELVIFIDRETFGDFPQGYLEFSDIRPI